MEKKTKKKLTHKIINQWNIEEGKTYKTPIGEITMVMFQRLFVTNEKTHKVRSKYRGLIYLHSIDMMIPFTSILYIHNFIQDNKELKPFELCCKLREVNKCNECCRCNECKIKGGLENE